MRIIAAVIGVFVIGLGSVSARAGDDHQHPCPGPECLEPTRPVCFNLICHFELKDDGHEKQCTVGSTFTKDVTVNGGEVQDDSTLGNNPTLEVTCGNHKIYGPSGSHRFTDLLGTRIQGDTGPNPALLLPRGELHSGPTPGQSGSHYSTAVLELADEGFQRARGSCFIWTGAP